jgi:DNA-directed RNA polymerase specialized sigma24 family protein
MSKGSAPDPENDSSVELLARVRSPLEAAIGKEGVAKYETALQSLRDEDRQAIVGRVEMGYSYQETPATITGPLEFDR